MSTENTVVPATQAPEVAPVASSEEFSLAAYRASRESVTPAAASNSEETTEEIPSDALAETPADESAPDSETEDEIEQEEEAEAPAEGDKKKGKGGFQKRIGKLTGERDRLATELETLKARLAGNPAAKPNDAPPPAGPQFDQPKPKLEDFPSIDAFTEAMGDWKADERDFKRAAAEQAKTLVDSWQSKTEAAKAKYADYQAKLDAASDIAFSIDHQRVVFESEHGPEVAYFLASNRAELQRIAGLSPLAAAREIGRLETRFASASVQQPKPKVSSAPAPIKPVASKSSAVTPSDTTDFAAYRAARLSGKLR